MRRDGPQQAAEETFDDVDDLPGRLRSCRDAAKHRREYLGRTLEDKTVELVDTEGRVRYQRRDVAVEIAAARNEVLNRVQSVLPSSYGGIAAQTVFEEQKPAVGPKHTMEFGKRGADRSDRTQGERRNHCVKARVLERESIACVELDLLDGHFHAAYAT